MVVGPSLLLLLAMQAPLDVVPTDVERRPTPAADGPVRVLVLDIQPGSLEAGTARAAGDLVTVALSERRGVEVASGADIQRAMELEGEKAALGCDDDSCLAELAGALGADLVVFGRGSTLGSVNILYLSLFDSTTGKTVGRVTIEFDDASELLHKVPPAVGRLADTELAKRGATPPTAADDDRTAASPTEQRGDGPEEVGEEEEPSTWPAWLMVGIGAPSIVFGVVSTLAVGAFGWGA
jgi:hypothetical protein